ncbi:unnamed protein product [Prorocentrum cordatum]|uniref:Cellulase n=1 Tax=Prorocentrum cordatum TaxID=2364126 RepID=A0ABN9SYG2_9DINO|nr:unnamed protein product [Polarella glacialis]
MRADRSPFLPLQLPLDSDCEPGAIAPRALRAPREQRTLAGAAALSAAAAALALLVVAWRAGPSTGTATLASPEAIIVEAAGNVSGADPNETDKCSQTGASCDLSKCCSEPGAKCYKKDDGWSSCNQTCNPYYMWTVDDGWVKTNETVWDCEEIRLPCTENGASCALSKCCSDPYAKCYKKNAGWSSCNQTCDPNSKWMDDRWVKTNETVWDCEVISVGSTDVSTDSDAGNVAATRARRAGQSCDRPMCCSEPGARCYKKDDGWSSCNQTCGGTTNSMWMYDRWVKTDNSVWDCKDLTVTPVESADPIKDAEAEDETGTCSQNGASCTHSKCCSEPGSKCYKKDDGWSSCNQTCDPNSKWTVDYGWVKTNETVWDCEEIRLPCTENGASCALSKCCSDPYAKCYKKSAGWSSCNQTCDPNSKWMDDRWVKTNETVWDCEVISVDSTDVSTDSDAGNVAATACSQTGQSCEQTMCCSEPGAKCYKKNDGWSSCNQTCDPNSKWTVDDGWVKTNETVWDCEEIRPPCTHNGASCALSKCCSEPGAKCYKKDDWWSSCNQTCDPNSMWMMDRWVKTDNSVWDCKDLTVTPVESADPIKDAEAEDENGTCSQNGASCTNSKCCSEPGSKCYKKDDDWSSCNQTCNPYYVWTDDNGWVKTNETVWDCEEIRLPCTENGASCALSKCCSDPYAKCYKKSAGWSSCNRTCDPNSKWMDDRWVKTDNSVWDCKDLTVTPVESADPIKDAEAEDETGTCSQNGASCTHSKCCSEPGSKCYKKDDGWSSCNQTCDPNSKWTVDDGWVKTNETVWDCEEIRLPCTENGASCALSKCCSDPYAKCYKKSAGWSSCNQTCDPNSKWMDDRWVKTNETVWDCEVISVDSTDVSTDSDAGNVAATACSQTGQSCEQTMCCSEPGAKCYKKNDGWSSCNQTCDPYYMWTVDNGWVKTNETVWDCEEIRPPCTHNGASCALSKLLL